MKPENEIRLLFERYAEEVGGYLPRRKRADIQLEIVSLLEDTLDDLSAREGRPADEDLALSVLKSLGAPIKFARAYQPDDNLMRPETFQLFKPVAVFVGGLVLLELFLTLGLSAGKAGVDWGVILLDWFEGIFTAFGTLVLSFALIERTTPAAWLNWPVDQISKDWDPAGLKKRLHKKLVNSREYWLETLWLVLLIVWFGLFPQYVGVGGNLNGQWAFLPVLAETFSLYQPWIVLYFLARLVFSVTLARQAYWDTRMRIVQTAVKLVGLGLLYAMLTGPAVIGLNPAYIALHNTPEYMQLWMTSELTNTAFYLVVGINLAVHSALTALQVFKMVRERSLIDGVGISLT